MANLFREYVNSLDENGEDHLVIMDADGELWSTRNHTRHKVTMVQKRSLRRGREGYEIREQVGWFVNWGLVFVLLLLCVAFFVIWLVV